MNTGPTPQDLLLAYDTDFIGFTGDVTGGTIDGYYEDFSGSLNHFAKKHPLMFRQYDQTINGKALVLPMASFPEPLFYRDDTPGVVSLSDYIIAGRQPSDDEADDDEADDGAADDGEMNETNVEEDVYDFCAQPADVDPAPADVDLMSFIQHT